MINLESEIMLRDIRKVLDRKGADWRVIIHPLYDQIIFNRDDLNLLQEIFGADRVYDFSGNPEFTNDPTHYIDSSHFKPAIGKEVLRRVYAR